jgi:hypothetical protein
MSEHSRPPAVDPANLPTRLAARPRDRRGLPIPLVNLHPDPATGEPKVDFTTINTTVSTALAAERRCSLCTGETGYWVAFLGGPRAAELMQYTDPPGCVDCMTWAVRLCPFIVVQRHRRLHGDLAGAGELPPGSHGEKPPYWVLGITRSYRAVPLPGSVSASGFTAYLPAPFRAIHTYTYAADGRINPVPTIRRG